MTIHPIYEAINKPLLLLGVDRRACAAAIMAVLLPRVVAAVCKQFGLFQSMLGLRGLLVGAILGVSIWTAARMAAASDARFVSLLLVSLKLRTRYDAGRVR